MPDQLIRAAACVTLALSAAATAELHPRLGGAAAYDDVLGITWLTNAGLSGSDSWDSSLSWVAGLNAVAHLGFNDWRLASMSVAAGLPIGLADAVVDCSTIWAPLCQDNELGYMFYHTLGGTTGADLSGTHTLGDVTLTDVQATYWSATQSGVTNAWMYHFDIGFGVWSAKNGKRHAWAVRQGDSIAPDTDGDGVGDAVDNCIAVANDGQHDSNGDGIGNLCDADLTGPGGFEDCLVNFLDLHAVAEAFFSRPGLPAWNPDADLDNDGQVNFIDVQQVRRQFFGPPGPSAAGCN